jgi:hypothetical protein
LIPDLQFSWRGKISGSICGKILTSTENIYQERAANSLLFPHHNLKMGAPTSPNVSASASDKDVSIPHNKVAFDGEPGSEEDDRPSNSTDLIDPRKELYDSTVIDPVLARKMTLVNDAIDEIGMTPFQWKLFFLNGFGYAVDSVSPYGVRSPLCAFH